MGREYKKCFTCYRSTGEESVPRCIQWAATHGYVIINLTFCTLATKINTWVHTFIINASLVWRTIRIVCTFWLATQVWISEIVRPTRALAIITICICSTGARITFVVYGRHMFWNKSRNFYVSTKWFREYWKKKVSNTIVYLYYYEWNNFDMGFQYSPLCNYKQQRVGKLDIRSEGRTSQGRGRDISGLCKLWH